MAKSEPESQIAIIGTGLIGASVGHVLMGKSDRNYRVIGFDLDKGHGKKAKKLGAIDDDAGSLRAAVKEASLIVLSMPIGGARLVMEEIAPHVREGVIVTDTCSSKQDIMTWAAELLPEHVNFVGGHPMAGSTDTGPEAASADLFKDAYWAITPSTTAESEAIQVVQGLVETAGANTLYIDPEEHDMWAAAVSHMPLLLSVALFRTVRDSEGWEDASLMAGPGFIGATRLASTDHRMSTGIFETNRDATLHWLGRVRDELGTIMKAVELGGDAVEDLLKKTSFEREVFLDSPRGRVRKSSVETPSASDTMASLLMGGAAYEKLKEITEREPELDRDDLRRELGIRRNGERN